MDSLSSAERMKRLAMKSGIDRVPVIPLVSGYAALAYGITVTEFYLGFASQTLAFHSTDQNCTIFLPKYPK
jgi:hypothetical protein